MKTNNIDYEKRIKLKINEVNIRHEIMIDKVAKSINYEKKDITAKIIEDIKLCERMLEVLNEFLKPNNENI